jgi:hypothetical protein
MGIALFILILVGIIYFVSKDDTKEKRNKFIEQKKAMDNSVKPKTFEEVKKESESKGYAALTKHIESVVKTHPETVKKLTEADKKALGVITTKKHNRRNSNK